MFNERRNVYVISPPRFVLQIIHLWTVPLKGYFQVCWIVRCFKYAEDTGVLVRVWLGNITDLEVHFK